MLYLTWVKMQYLSSGLTDSTVTFVVHTPHKNAETHKKSWKAQPGECNNSLLTPSFPRFSVSSPVPPVILTRQYLVRNLISKDNQIDMAILHGETV